MVMVNTPCCAGAAVAVYFILLTTLCAASPLYENNSLKLDSTIHAGAAAKSATESSTIGDFILQGLDLEEKADSASPSNISAESTNESPSKANTTVDNSFYKYTTRVEDGWITETSKTLRPTGPISWASPMPEVEKCWSDIVTWRDSSIKWWNKNIAETPFPASAMTEQTTILRVTETSWETTIYPTSLSDYTLCDGTPRVDARPETRTTTFNVTHSNVQTVPKEFAFPQTQPCIPDPKTCRLWYYDSNINVTNEAELLQLCGKPTGLYEPCLVRGGPVQLIYWPEESGEDHVCPNNASLPFREPKKLSNQSNATMHETVTALGTTFTSGSVYLSFHTLYASYDGFYDRVGPTFKDTIIPVPSSAMSTHCGGLTEAHGPGTALSYADLNWPVPARAYECQARCDQAFVPLTNRSVTPPECKTIWSDVNPNIAIPTMVKDLVPEWSSCEMSGFRIPNFWFDPPVMLTKKGSIAMPSTFHAEPTKEPPAPSLRSTSSTPKETGSPQGSVGKDAETMVANFPSKAHEPDGPRPTSPEAGKSEYLPVVQAPPPNPAEPEAVRQSDSASEDPVEDSTAQRTIGDSNPTKTSSSGDFTTRFSYQPITSSLDALSVLQSALGDLSKSGLHPSVEYTNSHEAYENTSGRGTQTSAFSAGLESGKGTGNEDPTLPIVTTAPEDPTNTVTPVAGNPTSEPPAVTTSNHAAYTPPSSNANQISYVGSGDDNGAGIASSDTAEATTGTTNPSESDTTPSSGNPVSSTNGILTNDELPPVVAAPSQESGNIHLSAPSLVVTANTISGSPGAISVGGTTLVEEGDIATLESGETLRLDPSGIVVLKENTTVTMSSVTSDGATPATTRETFPTSSMPSESSNDASEPSEGVGGKIEICNWAVVVAALMLVVF